MPFGPLEGTIELMMIGCHTICHIRFPVVVTAQYTIAIVLYLARLLYRRTTG